MKTTDEPIDLKKDKEKEATRTVFALLLFRGDPTVNYPNSIAPVDEGFGFIISV